MKHCILTHSLDGAQPEPDVAFTVDGKLQEAFVDVGPQHFYSHASGLLHHDGDLLYVIDVPAQYCRHELSRVVCLEVSCLVGYQRITGGV